MRLASTVLFVVLLAGVAPVSRARPLVADTTRVVAAADSAGGNRYWWTELKRGRVHFDNDSVRYPSFIKWVWTTVNHVDHSLNDYDTAYVSGYDKKFKVTLKNENWYDDYDYKVDDDKVKFHSAVTSSVGLYVSLLGITVGYQTSFDRLMGRTDPGSKFEISFNCARFTAEFYRMSNRGDMTMDYIVKGGGRLRLKHFTGLLRKSWNFNTYCIFNHRHYSQAAAYGFSKQQKRSAGSFLAGLSVSHRNFGINVDEVSDYFIDAEDREAIEAGGYPVATLFEYTDYSLSGGYAYSWVPGRRFLINASGLLFTGVKTTRSETTPGARDTMWAVNARLRAALCYNDRRFFAGVQAHLDSHFFNTGADDFHNGFYNIIVTAGIRF